MVPPLKKGDLTPIFVLTLMSQGPPRSLRINLLDLHKLVGQVAAKRSYLTNSLR
jgi:hypothetical protein